MTQLLFDARQPLKALEKIGHVMRKLAFCICKNKGTDQLRSNRAADQSLCFCYIDPSTS